MRLLKVTGAALMVLALPVGVQAGHPGTITEIVAASGGTFDANQDDFDILLNAVLAAELDGVLADPHADFTVFAPNDRAFIRLAREFGFESGGEAAAFGAIVAALTALGDGDPIPPLRNVLLYHVSPQAKSLHEILNSRIVPTALAGESVVSVRQRLLDNEPDLRDPRFVEGATDIAAQNGVIQVIDRVLIPLDIDNTDAANLATISGVVAASGGTFDHDGDDFDILLNALLAANLVDALDVPGDALTVFAPTDEAFVRTARSLGYHGDSEEGAFGFIVAALTELGGGDPIPLLTAVLQYHVAPEALPAKAVLESAAVATLLADAFLGIDALEGRLLDNDPNLKDARLLIGRSGIRTSNGFINPISRVLIPVDLSTL